MTAFFDNVRLALGTFFSNPLRTLLTLLGIVIGVATVIAMMGLIEGLKEKIDKDLGSLGADTFVVSKWPPGVNFNVDWKKIRQRPDLTLADAQAVREGCPDVLQVSAGDTDGGKLVSSAYDSIEGVMVGGYTPEYAETSGLTIAQGRFFGTPDVQNGLSVAVIGADIASHLFPNGQQALGSEIRIRGRPFQVIGVLSRRGTLLGMVNLDQVVYLPLDPFLDLYGRDRSLELDIQARTPKLVNKAMDEVTMLLRGRHRLKPSDEDDFDAATNDSMTSTFNSMSNAVSAAGFAICLLSLVVGGIGILNIMLVSVSERTQEIGVRKALGARRGRILMQFAIEATVMALVGGLIGVALGYGVAFLARWAFDFRTAVPLWAVLLALGVSSAVGLLFGIYPASRAARLDPVEAMRADA